MTVPAVLKGLSLRGKESILLAMRMAVETERS
jgi:hypothetical protein